MHGSRPQSMGSHALHVPCFPQEAAQSGTLWLQVERGNACAAHITCTPAVLGCLPAHILSGLAAAGDDGAAPSCAASCSGAAPSARPSLEPLLQEVVAAAAASSSSSTGGGGASLELCSRLAAELAEVGWRHVAAVSQVSKVGREE